MIKFGGHAMAAGLSLRPDAYATFAQIFTEQVNLRVDVSTLHATIYTDGPLTPEHMTLETASMLQQAGPWGQQFPDPVFDNVFEILAQRTVGQHHLKLTLALSLHTDPIDAIAFNVDPALWPNHRARYVHAAYTLDRNVYLGRTRLQLIISALNHMEQLP